MSAWWALFSGASSLEAAAGRPAAASARRLELLDRDSVQATSVGSNFPG